MDKTTAIQGLREMLFVLESDRENNTISPEMYKVQKRNIQDRIEMVEAQNAGNPG